MRDHYNARHIRSTHMLILLTVLLFLPQYAFAQRQELDQAIGLIRDAEKQAKARNIKQTLKTALQTTQKARDIARIADASKTRLIGFDATIGYNDALARITDALASLNKVLQSIVADADPIRRKIEEAQESLAKTVRRLEGLVFEETTRSNTIRSYREFIEKHPGSELTQRANDRIEELTSQRLRAPESAPSATFGKSFEATQSATVIALNDMGLRPLEVIGPRDLGGAANLYVYGEKRDVFLAPGRIAVSTHDGCEIWLRSAESARTTVHFRGGRCNEVFAAMQKLLGAPVQ